MYRKSVLGLWVASTLLFIFTLGVAAIGASFFERMVSSVHLTLPPLTAAMIWAGAKVSTLWLPVFWIPYLALLALTYRLSPQHVGRLLVSVGTFFFFLTVAIFELIAMRLPMM